ncbi:hypothetical protein D3C80_1429690 [compost metagenome]
MSNRKGAAALQREFLLSIIRFEGGMLVNAERGIGSKNPLLVRLIKDGHVKLVRKSTRTVLHSGKGYMNSRHRTLAVSVERINVEHVICPGCGERCSALRTEAFPYRHVTESHKYDCPVRQDHSGDGWFDRRKTEIACGLKGKHVAPSNDVNYTGRQLERRYRRDKIKRAKIKTKRKVTITVTHEQSIA